MLEGIKELNLSPEAKTTLDSLCDYYSSFTAILMSAIWIKVLVLIDRRNKVLQARNMTIVEMSNLESLLKDLKEIREGTYSMKRS